MSTSEGESLRCQGCGEVLEADERIVQITSGELSLRKLSATKGAEILKSKTRAEWGYMHDSCFRIAIGDPEAINALAETA